MPRSEFERRVHEINQIMGSAFPVKGESMLIPTTLFVMAPMSVLLIFLWFYSVIFCGILFISSGISYFLIRQFHEQRAIRIQIKLNQLFEHYRGQLDSNRMIWRFSIETKTNFGRPFRKHIRVPSIQIEFL